MESLNADEPDTVLPGAGRIKDGMTYDQRLFHYTWDAGRDEPYFMAFRNLQRLNIVHLQNELAKKKRDILKKMAASKQDMEDLKTLLRDYCMFSIPLHTFVGLNRFVGVDLKSHSWRNKRFRIHAPNETLHRFPSTRKTIRLNPSIS